jgi:hypothetical protein
MTRDFTKRSSPIIFPGSLGAESLGGKDESPTVNQYINAHHTHGMDTSFSDSFGKRSLVHAAGYFWDFSTVF